MRSGDHSPVSLQKGTEVYFVPFLYFGTMKYFVYILYSQLKDRYYIGYSQDPYRRLEEHNSGATKSTRPRRPWKIVCIEKYKNKSMAIKRELEIKKMKSRKYIESLIKNYIVG
jgi:putative endonuclease